MGVQKLTGGNTIGKNPQPENSCISEAVHTRYSLDGAIVRRRDGLHVQITEGNSQQADLEWMV